MFQLTYSNQFKKDLKRLNRNPEFHLERLEGVLGELQKNLDLEPRYRLHKLQGSFQGCYECHVQPDTLLIFEADIQSSVLYLLRLGSHAELF